MRYRAPEHFAVRLNLNLVNNHLLDRLHQSAPHVQVVHNALDIVLLNLPGDLQVAIHLVERDIDLGELRRVLEQNARAGRHTLFVLWAAMLLPEHGELYAPYDWMSALLGLYGSKIYAFETAGQHCWLFPVYFDHPLTGTVRRIRYGDLLDLGTLRGETVFTEGQFLIGRWQVAACDDAPFHTHGQRRTADAPQAEGRFTLRVYFELLGLRADADAETVRAAYRRLAMQFHPDRNAAPEATLHMQRLNTAYEQIMRHLNAAEDAGAA
jgi:hypothetical protein